VGDASDLRVLARLIDCNVYTALNARNDFRAPTEFCLCLTGEQEALRCLACESERTRTCWLTAMRLAKVSQSCLLDNLIRRTDGRTGLQLVWVDGHMDGGRVQWTQNNWELRWPLEVDTWEGGGDRKTIHKEREHNPFLVLYGVKQVQASEVSQRRTAVSSKCF
jgi:hypothetical protein